MVNYFSYRIGEREFSHRQNEKGFFPMDRIALTPQTIACINALLVSSQQNHTQTSFAADEIVELFESFMPEPAQRIEPVWSARTGRWQWLPFSG